jgi:hypothetical protein
MSPRPPPPRPATPFEGTPADAFAKGAAGIVMPTATALADFSVEEVAAALGTVKKALVAGRISETMRTSSGFTPSRDSSHLPAITS